MDADEEVPASCYRLNLAYVRLVSEAQALGLASRSVDMVSSSTLDDSVAVLGDSVVHIAWSALEESWDEWADGGAVLVVDLDTALELMQLLWLMSEPSLQYRL